MKYNQECSKMAFASGTIQFSGWVLTNKLHHFFPIFAESQFWQQLPSPFCNTSIFIRMPTRLYSFSLRAAIFTPPISKHISISMRWINQISLWGPVCQKFFHQLQQNQGRSPPADWQAHGRTSPLTGRPTTWGLHPRENLRERFPSNHDQLTSCVLKSHLPMAFLTFPLAVTIDFQSSYKQTNKQKSIQWDDIKSQQDKNLAAAIQSKMLPPARLLVLSLQSYFKTLLCFPLSNN